MPELGDRDRPHIFIVGRTEGISFTNPSAGGGDRPSLPPRVRAAHADHLMRELDAIRNQDLADRQVRTSVGLPTDYGLVVEFASHPNWSLPSTKLDRPNSDIALLNIRTRQIPQSGGQSMPQEFATVRIPFGKLAVFERLVNQYRDKNTIGGNARNEGFIAPVDDIRRAAFEAFWTDRSPIGP
jgi:hypothetical protein